jgi:predicted aldo/keto reductase-like oxidoreductase
MQYRRFGRTHQQISVFSLGTMRSLSTPKLFAQTVERAIALGINHLETAQGYGKSEAYLGELLATSLASQRPELKITTKITPQPDAPTMTQAIQASRQRLRIETIDFLAIHGINTPQHLAWVMDPNGCMAAVRKAIAAGQIGHVGCSTHGPLDLILGLIESDQFDFINLHYSYFFQRNAPAIAQAQAQDLGIFIISPADKGGQLYTPPRRLQDLCAPYDPLHFNARFLLGQSAITTLSVGPAKPEDLDWPLAIADQTQPPTTDEQAIATRLEQAATQALDTDYCRQCYACLPCPEAINIPEVLRLRNLALAFGMDAFAQYRYQMFEQAGHWFPGRRGDRCTDCGDCLPNCPEQLAINTLVKDAHNRFRDQPYPRLWEGI